MIKSRDSKADMVTILNAAFLIKALFLYVRLPNWLNAIFLTFRDNKFMTHHSNYNLFEGSSLFTSVRSRKCKNAQWLSSLSAD